MLTKEDGQDPNLGKGLSGVVFQCPWLLLTVLQAKVAAANQLHRVIVLGYGQYLVICLIVMFVCGLLDLG